MRLGVLSFAVTVVFIATTSSSEARLGQSIESFKGKLAPAYKFKSMNKKEDRSYYMFALIVDDKTRAKAPGFGAGITATVVDGKVMGQSMALRLGDDYAGRELATLHAMDFAYEALGKGAPASPEAAKREFDQYASAIGDVLSGNPQHVQYPGSKSLITMSRTNDGDVLVAVTPSFGDKPAAKKAH